MKNIAILGSTGSIGQNTLDIVRRFPDRFRVIGLSVQSNIDVLFTQIKEFKPDIVCVADIKKAKQLVSRIGKANKIKVYAGKEGAQELVSDSRVDEVVMAISGSGALRPLLEAIDCRKDIILANKEALAMAGRIIMDRAVARKVNIKPVDSEQSAIWQCLNGQDRFKLNNIYLTASGGPFRDCSRQQLKRISVSDALKHPRWKMGRKITVDSATLMNKGLEVLEAMFLFAVEAEKIKVIIHPEAIIHSMVEFIDGVIMAQLSITDMRIPIQYALSYPERLSSNGLPPVDFFRLSRFNFFKPDFKKFPCLGLAYRAAKESGTTPCVLNASNEVSVEAFLNKEIGFLAIPRIIEHVMDRHKNKNRPALDDIFAADVWARQETRHLITNKYKR